MVRREDVAWRDGGGSSREEGVADRKGGRSGTRPSGRKKWNGWMGEEVVGRQGSGKGIKKGEVQLIVCCKDKI